MSNSDKDNFDEHDSSDHEADKKGFESLLANPSYFSSSMKVRIKCVLVFSYRKVFLTLSELVASLA